MRTLIAALIVICAPVAASNYRDVQRAVADDSMLASAGVEPSKAELRMPCSAAVLDSDSSPNLFNCVYVQTDRDLNLFSLEGGYLMSELQLTLTNMDGVALQHMGRYSQVQIFSGERVAALSIYGQNWIDPAQTEVVYTWLLEHGVRPHAPRAWLGH